MAVRTIQHAGRPGGSMLLGSVQRRSISIESLNGSSEPLCKEHKEPRPASFLAFIVTNQFFWAYVQIQTLKIRSDSGYSARAPPKLFMPGVQQQFGSHTAQP